MRTARARLLIAALAFSAWVGWLGYQALSRGRDYDVLSHSQFLKSTLDVIADVRAGEEGRADPKVTIRDVLWPAAHRDLVDTSITVANLPSSDGFRGPGQYILPLVLGELPDEYRVAGVPLSPGFDGALGKRPIYRLDERSRRQLAAISKPG